MLMKGKRMRLNEGFTLVELLAVIVVLAILLGVAIPAVSNYVSNSKKDSFISNAELYLKEARSKLIVSGELPTDGGSKKIVALSSLDLEKGKRRSAYGNKWNYQKSYIVVTNEGTTTKPNFVYSIALEDAAGYCVNLTSERNLKREIIQRGGCEIEKANFYTLKAVSPSYNGEIWAYRDSIAKIVFEDSLKEIEGAIGKFDLSEDGSGLLMAYVVPNADNTTHTAYIQGDGKVAANSDSSYLFAGFSKLQEIVGLENFDTSDAVDMIAMFSGSTALVNLDLSSFDTSNVKNMIAMFEGCYSLETLDVSNFNTDNVIDMQFMFNYCLALKSLNLNSFNTENVTNMNYMFKYCIALENLKIDNFSTKSATSMQAMFSGCRKLKELNFTGFVTTQKPQINSIFQDMRALIKLDISNADFSNYNANIALFSRIPAAIEVKVKNETAKSFIENRLGSGVGIVSIKN